MSSLCLPHFARGKVINGFGRGSKELGIPTANLPAETVNDLPEGLKPGVYYGWAKVDYGEVHKMVMSIGWNPFYKNKQKSMERGRMRAYSRNIASWLVSEKKAVRWRKTANYI